MSEFIKEALSENTMRALVFVVVVGAWIYLRVSGLPVPPELDSMAAVVIGYYFGGALGKTKPQN